MDIIWYIDHMHKPPQWMSDWYEQSLNQFKSTDNRGLDSVEAASDDFIDYDSLPSPLSPPNVAIVKLNGGLGTSMGCNGPKSLIPCVSNRTFLDIIIQQHEASPISSSLILLNSFNTSADTNTFFSQSYPTMKWTEIMQYPFKKINARTQQPYESNDVAHFNPPGHGSVYFDLYHSGCLSTLKELGISYVFISNADNLAATCDPKIAQYMATSGCPFLMELTQKKPSDIKGGTVVRSNNHYRLWEIAQVGDDQLSDFHAQPYFNTNNIWVNIDALIQAIESHQLQLDLIFNKKTSGVESFIQLEYAMGSAIQSFHNGKAMVVPRQRFLPVKTTSDLLLLKSNVVAIDSNGALAWDTDSSISIQLNPPFHTIDGFNHYLKAIPLLKDATRFELTGPVYFNHTVSCIGNVAIKANHSSPICIHPDIHKIEGKPPTNALISTSVQG